MSRSIIVFAALSLCVGQSVSETRTPPLKDLLIQIQHSNVRESWGENSGENFSDEDRKLFLDKKTTDQIVAKLKSDKIFIAAVELVRKMSAEMRVAYLADCRKTRRKTWEEAGRISREGTTVAGAAVEESVARAVVDLAERMLEVRK